MSLPIPSLPEGCIQITFQANIEGYPATTRTLAPRLVSKLITFLPTVPHTVNGETVYGFPGLTELFEYVVTESLLKAVEDRYPDTLPPEILALEAELVAAKAAALPKFI